MPLPLLYLDVDGPLNVLNRWPEEPHKLTVHRVRPQCWVRQHPNLHPDDVPELVLRLNPDHGAELADLPYELVWGTTWEEEANEFIGPRIGLPALPVVTWSNLDGFGPEGTYFKTAELVRHAAGRPFAWVDDQLGQADREYVARHHPAPALLHYVDPAKGLDLDDFETLAAWVDTLPAEYQPTASV
ncbi:hypothetical protein ACFY4B_27415 [Kitasatospora sp. NPDC001261]|uniref:hypothetical protein n=1 Tax=Kitasatospora sp. NPDC001261 TaxID=3364012 RepID=UPI00368A5CA8